jgi:hypothetical protein
MSVSVADRVLHRMPRPVRCDACGSPKIELQSKKLMGLTSKGRWDLIWHCGECGAFVGCHQGTDIPLGLMADRDTRHARYMAHETLDPLWRGRRAVATRPDVYAWIAAYLGIAPEVAHISMLNEDQCNKLVAGVSHFTDMHRAISGRTSQHWQQKTRKKRRK